VHCYRQASLVNVPLHKMRVIYGPASCALTDRVHGDGRTGLPCTAERTALGDCGPDGRHFQRLPTPAPAPVKSRRWWQWWRA
jgi:hypothetical protein